MLRLPDRLVMILLALILVALPDFAIGQSKVTTPKPGTPERKAIMDALRIPVGKVVKKKVIFNVGSLKTLNGWALLQGNAVDEKGKSLGSDFLWGEIAALLKKSGKQWKVLHWGFATDTGTLDEIKKKYPQSPQGIF